ncbi:MAG TPA: glycosyltransferase family A protein [Candidatus Limnocylindria bacterium]|nr:glycosyltransferase family A protein [Candidatus Limnocylindria bacterium]
MNDRPFSVSAVIPAHDALPFVLEAVESVLAQRRPAEEIVVVDDGSSDGTGAAVEQRFADAHPAVRVVRGRFGSAAAARNAGWQAARSPWIAFLDADDLWFPDKLAAAEAALDAVPSAGWFFSDGAFRTLTGELHHSWLASYAELPEPYAGRPLAELLEVNFILTSSVVVRRDLLAATGGFDAKLSHAEDVDLWIRLARRAPATASRRSLVRYQHREGGLTRQLESRLLGDVALFGRLAGDRELAPPLRRRARHRASLAHFKLGFAALRAGRGREARRAFGAAWLFPERALPVAGAWLASWLPAAWLAGLRRQRWAVHGVAAPALRQDRVALRAEPALLPISAPGGAS